MKKIKVLFVFIVALLSFGFVSNTHAAEPVTEEPVTEVVTEEPGFAMPDVNYENLYQTWTAIISWAGGVTGMAALTLYGIKALKERKLLKNVKEITEKLDTSDKDKTVKMAQLYETVAEYNIREEKMEKMVLTLVSMSNVDPKLRKEIVESIENPSVSLGDVLGNKLESIKQEVEDNATVEAEIVKETKSLLSKIADEEEEA
jgi:ribosomal protein S13